MSPALLLDPLFLGILTEIPCLASLDVSDSNFSDDDDAEPTDIRPLLATLATLASRRRFAFDLEYALALPEPTPVPQVTTLAMREAQLADADISNLLASFEHATGIHFAGSSRDLPAALIQHVVTSRSPRLTSLHIDSEYGDAPMSLFAAVLSTRMPTLRDLRLIARTLPKKPLETITAGAPFPGLESLQLKTYKESIPLSDI
jgi:hypothetical protein